MKRLTTSILVTLAVLLGSAGEGFALPECPGSPKTGSLSTVKSWNNCEGTVTYGSKSQWTGDKYVGEYKDGKSHGQGTVTFADGRVLEGIWENHEFKFAQKITPTVTAKKTPPPSKGEGFALPECPSCLTSAPMGQISGIA